MLRDMRCLLCKQTQLHGIFPTCRCLPLSREL